MLVMGGALARDRFAVHEELVERLDFGEREANEVLVDEIGHEPPGLAQLPGVVARGDLEFAREAGLVEVDPQLREQVGGDDMELVVAGKGSMDREADIDVIEVPVFAVRAVSENARRGLGDASTQDCHQGVEVEAPGGMIGEAQAGEASDAELGTGTFAGRDAGRSVALEVAIRDTNNLTIVLRPG
jgi:hypothetical protein